MKLLVLWMLVFPLVCGIEDLLHVWRNKLESKPPVTDGTRGMVGLINVLIYIAVAGLLWSAA